MERTDRDMLKRIAALLFALAELADRASLASLPVRTLLLAILHPAEAVARAFVFGVARDLGVTILPQASLDGGDSDQATRLAYSLRVLGLVLAHLSAQAERCASRGSCRIVVKTKVLRKPGQLVWRHCQGAPTFDTS